MDAALLAVLRVAGPTVLVFALWTVWERRLTLGSRLDSSATMCGVLFGVGAALDAPWPQIAAATHSLTGRYYVLNMVGHLCYLGGAALGVRSIYLRLLPDDVFDRVMRTWLAPSTIGVAAVMVGSFWASRIPLSESGDHLYLVRPDGWLTVYFVVHFGTATLLGIVCFYGIQRLRRDPRGVMLNVMLAALALAAISGGVIVGWGAVTGRVETLRLLGWLVTYAAFVIAGVASVIQWRRRVRALSNPPHASR